MCGDFAVVNAPFSGVLAGPVGRVGPDGIQYDGVKILSDGKSIQLNVSLFCFDVLFLQFNSIVFVYPLTGTKASKALTGHVCMTTP